MRFRWHVVVLLCGVVAALRASGPFLANSQQAEPPSSIGAIEGKSATYSSSRRFDAFDSPWSAIGRLIIGPAVCHAVLIEPDVVLTAAHCLWDRHKRSWVKPEAVKFQAGVIDGRFAFESGVFSIHIPPRTRMAADGGIGNPNADFATLSLETPLGLNLDWLDVIDADETSLLSGVWREIRFLHLSHGTADRPDPVVHNDCQVNVPYPAEGLVYTLCDIARGDSGSPLLAKVRQRYGIAALHIGTLANPSVDYKVAIVGRIVASELRRRQFWQHVP